jgi:hypothetical protein
LLLRRARREASALAITIHADRTPRVVLLTSPGLFGAEIINRLADARGIRLVGVGLTDRLYKGKGFVAGVHTFLGRTGWRYLGYNALQSTASWSWLRLTGRPSGLKSLPNRPRMLKDINSPATVSWLKSLQPDFIVSYFFNQWIGPDVRSAAARDAINVHPSLLPALRGPDPVFRTLERGLTTSGLTIHRIADELDLGQILHQEEFVVPAGLTAFGLYLKVIREGSDLVARWLAGAVPPAPHFIRSSGPGDYSTFPTAAEVAHAHRTGCRLVDMSEWRAALARVR